MNDLVAAVLTVAQQEVVAFFRALNVPAHWFIGVPDPHGGVEVVAIGSEDHFVWSLIIDPSGAVTSSEAQCGEFSSGIEV